ncbi:MAG: DUF4129 domain-containing protein [Microbacterium sp.]|uniref:Protein-glutamine gamma-glutamyltransferase-like C-terminal domain-containing protein n=1 Tax=Microbacterium natoriense TaxID=284570 RepID=A0AAW8EX15_9MICO|nr:MULTISPECIES: DUF4129 domain-containing protein [Microbacterium]MBW8761667.1 DUF4129 domain-containing protein [Microbacterium sp.]MDQ0647798.1 hypothetical protein [Microbacterium natoriense]
MILRFDDVFVPDGDDARRWAEEELSNQRYAEAKPTWFDLLARDIARFIADLFNSDNTANVGPSALIIVSVLIFAALVTVLIIWGRPRRPSAVRRLHGGLLGAEDDRSAAQLRADADRAAKAEDWDEATILRFRALARGLLERDLIDPTPGATAQGIAREVGMVFPAETASVRAAAVSFDDVRYLRHPASPQSYAQLAAADDRLSALRPEAVPA